MGLRRPSSSDTRNLAAPTTFCFIHCIVLGTVDALALQATAAAISRQLLPARPLCVRMRFYCSVNVDGVTASPVIIIRPSALAAARISVHDKAYPPAESPVSHPRRTSAGRAR